jgi:hypothetical protein
MTDEETDDWHEYDPCDPADECDHAEADIDLLTGELSCRCGLRRAATAQEIAAESRWQTEYSRKENEAAMGDHLEQHNTELDARSAT